MSVKYDYSEWDGTQEFADLDPDDLLAGLTDDLLAGGDLDDALRRLLRSGFRTADGDHVAGLRDLLDQLRRRRQEMLAEGDPDGRMAELTRQLDEIEQDERAAIDDLVEDAAASGDERRREVTDDVATERRMALDLQPDDPAGRISSLQHYDFVSSEARERFEELVEELRREMADTFFEGASDALSNMNPEQMQRMREAYDALNRMLEQRERGEELDPSFEEFMAEFGDMFPGNPENLDELLEQLAQRMAAAQAVWNSLSPEQRAQLSQLMEAVLEDMDLRWQVERLAENLQRAFPDAGWQQSYDFNGEGPMSLSRATDLASQLGQLDRMEEVLQSASTPAALGEIDLDQVRQHMGEDAARALDRLANLTKSLADAGLIEQQGGRIELTPRGVRRLGQKALADLFGQINKDRLGDHSAVLTGLGPRPRGDDQGLRVRRPAQPPSLDHGAQRGTPQRLGRAGPPHARGLRGGRGRGAVALGHRALRRPVHVDAHARQLRAGQAHGHGAADADLVQVPARLPRHHRLLRGRPRDTARRDPHRHVGLRLRHQSAARAGAARDACWPTSTGPSRSSW